MPDLVFQALRRGQAPVAMQVRRALARHPENAMAWISARCKVQVGYTRRAQV